MKCSMYIFLYKGNYMEIDKRLKRVPEEMRKSQQYDYQILNEDLDNTTTEIFEIIKNHNHQY